jgi:hypothetical protein
MLIRFGTLLFPDVIISTHGVLEGNTHITTETHQPTTHAMHKQNYTSDFKIKSQK